MLRNRESEILEQYIDVYVRQFIEGMDQTFIDEHSSSISGHSEQVGSPKMNSKWLRTSLNIDEEEPIDEV